MRKRTEQQFKFESAITYMQHHVLPSQLVEVLANELPISLDTFFRHIAWVYYLESKTNIGCDYEEAVRQTPDLLYQPTSKESVQAGIMDRNIFSSIYTTFKEIVDEHFDDGGEFGFRATTWFFLTITEILDLEVTRVTYGTFFDEYEKYSQLRKGNTAVLLGASSGQTLREFTMLVRAHEANPVVLDKNTTMLRHVLPGAEIEYSDFSDDNLAFDEASVDEFHTTALFDMLEVEEENPSQDTIDRVLNNIFASVSRCLKKGGRFIALERIPLEYTEAKAYIQKLQAIANRYGLRLVHCDDHVEAIVGRNQVANYWEKDSNNKENTKYPTSSGTFVFEKL